MLCLVTVGCLGALHSTLMPRCLVHVRRLGAGSESGWSLLLGYWTSAHIEVSMIVVVFLSESGGGEIPTLFIHRCLLMYLAHVGRILWWRNISPTG
jgi:hypothetical protein